MNTTQINRRKNKFNNVCDAVLLKKKNETERNDQSELSFRQENYKFVKNLQSKRAWAENIKLVSK